MAPRSSFGTRAASTALGGEDLSQTVTLLGGPFAGAEGSVTAIDGGTVSVRVTLFGWDLETKVGLSHVLARP